MQERVESTADVPCRDTVLRVSEVDFGEKRVEVAGSVRNKGCVVLVKDGDDAAGLEAGEEAVEGRLRVGEVLFERASPKASGLDTHNFQKTSSSNSPRKQ